MSALIDNQYLAVIDTETNLLNEVMSIGVVIAQKNTYHIVAEKYYIITPECEKQSFFGYALNYYTPFIKCEREEAISDLRSFLQSYQVENVFAYNASFDYNQLYELRDFTWHDIMQIAAYKQYNPCIPDDAELCSTGRLKSNYGVESIMRLLLKNERYSEKHNAVYDARDELLITQMMGYPIDQYPSIGEKSAKKAHTRIERHESRKKEIQEQLQKENVDLISFEATNKPITIKSRICGNVWDVKYYAVSDKIPKCPVCFPSVKTKPHEEKKTPEERLNYKAKEYADTISAKSDGKLKVTEYNGSKQKTKVICTVCAYTWEIRPDHLKNRCYCPHCKKSSNIAMTIE